MDPWAKKAHGYTLRDLSELQSKTPDPSDFLQHKPPPHFPSHRRLLPFVKPPNVQMGLPQPSPLSTHLPCCQPSWSCLAWPFLQVCSLLPVPTPRHPKASNTATLTPRLHQSGLLSLRSPPPTVCLFSSHCLLVLVLSNSPVSSPHSQDASRAPSPSRLSCMLLPKAFPEAKLQRHPFPSQQPSICPITL